MPITLERSAVANTRLEASVEVSLSRDVRDIMERYAVALGSAVSRAFGVSEFFVRNAPDPDQAWFWTPEWQAAEAEASADLEAGRFTRYESAEDFMRAMDELLADADV